MTKSHAIIVGPLTLACVATAFCVWSALGNDVNICVTTGCTLYQDFTIASISLWWFGAFAFTILGACALMGQATLGRRLAAFFLAADIGFLLLMAFTAPCVSCLVAALFFALCYIFFRRNNVPRKSSGQPAPHRASFLLWVWLILFIVNVGQVARSQVDIWPILDESGEASTRMFFSPSCRYCIEGVNALSGNINVAFYPLAESDADVAKVGKMLALLAQGESLAEAMGQSQETEFKSFWQNYTPAMLLLRFRMLRNKAHLFAQGAQGVPFFERKGLPADLVSKRERSAQASKPASASVFPHGDRSSGSGDYAMPPELQDSMQCGGSVPCEPESGQRKN